MYFVNRAACLFSQLTTALESLSKLKGQVYGEVSLEAGVILRLAKAAPFEGRLAALRAVCSFIIEILSCQAISPCGS